MTQAKMPKGRGASARDDYMTDPLLIDTICKALDIACFDFDACCSKANCVATLGTDNLLNFLEHASLAHELIGWVWCNPPFNKKNELVPALLREVLKHKKKMVMLLPIAVETKFWRDFVWHHTVIIPSGRIKFLDPTTGTYMENSAAFASAIVVVNLTLPEIRAISDALNANRTIIGVSDFIEMSKGESHETST